MLLEKAFEGAPVLVAGGYGFIGSNLVRRLVRLGARVTVVDALVPNTGANRFNLWDLEGLITVHVVDMVDEEAMRELMRGRTLVFKNFWSFKVTKFVTRQRGDVTFQFPSQRREGWC